MTDTKKDALKSTGIVGGAQIIKILIRIARIKIVAVLLGPTGVGIAGLYYSTVQLVQKATGMGLEFSAVRDIAEASGTNDQLQISRAITIMRRLIWLTGFLGLVIVVLFQKQLSFLAFKDFSHAHYFMMLSVMPLLMALNGGQLALMRGVRRIGDMALAGVLGAIAGLCITTPFYLLMGVKGIVPALILTAFAELFFSWYFSRKIKTIPVTINFHETITGGTDMVRLGLFTVVAGIVKIGTLYLIRIYISGQMGLDGVGQFQAAWNLSAIYVGLVLDAMATDYFPRLSAVHNDNAKVCKLANDQTEIALLLAGPLIVGMVCFMDVIVWLFYSDKFGQSISVLHWLTIGNLFKVITVPMGFVLLAKKRGRWFIFIELLWNVLLLMIIWLCWNRAGLDSIGISFLFSNLVLLGVNYMICKRLCDFSWSKKTKIIIISFTLLTTFAFFNVKYLNFQMWRLFGVGLLIISAYYSYYELTKIIDIKLVIKNILIKLKINFLLKKLNLAKRNRR